MLRLMADENFNGDILRGLLLREPHLDILRIQDTPLAGRNDPEVLAWAAHNDRILLTHDRATMPAFALKRLAESQEIAGVFVLDDRFPVGQAIQEVLLMNECSEQAEWNSRVVYLPL